MDIFAIIKLVMILSIIAAVSYEANSLWQENIAEPYKEDGRVERNKYYDPIIIQKDAQLKEANSAVGACEGNNAGLKAAAGRQTQALLDSKKAEEEAQAESAAIAKKYSLLANRNQTTINNLTQIAQTAGIGKESCEQERDEIDAMVRDAARRRRLPINADAGSNPNPNQN